MELCEGYGERIAKARRARDWSPRDLEKEIGERGFRYKGEHFHVSSTSINNYENETQKPSMAAVLAIALTTGVNPAHLLDVRAPETWNPRKESGLLAADVRRVARWMLDYAKGDGPIPPLADEEAPLIAKKKRRGIGKPQQKDGS